MCTLDHYLWTAYTCVTTRYRGTVRRPEGRLQPTWTYSAEGVSKPQVMDESIKSFGASRGPVVGLTSLPAGSPDAAGFRRSGAVLGRPGGSPGCRRAGGLWVVDDGGVAGLWTEGRPQDVGVSVGRVPRGPGLRYFGLVGTSDSSALPARRLFRLVGSSGSSALRVFGGPGSRWVGSAALACPLLLSMVGSAGGRLKRTPLGASRGDDRLTRPPAPPFKQHQGPAQPWAPASLLAVHLARWPPLAMGGVPATDSVAGPAPLAAADFAGVGYRLRHALPARWPLPTPRTDGYRLRSAHRPLAAGDLAGVGDRPTTGPGPLAAADSTDRRLPTPLGPLSAGRWRLHGPTTTGFAVHCRPPATANVAGRRALRELVPWPACRAK